MSSLYDVVNRDRDNLTIQRVKHCRSFFCRLRGLTFRRKLPAGVGLLLDEGSTSRVGTAIHMMAVGMELGIAWLDAEMKVVDTILAKPWRIYTPSAPARFILEGDPSMLEWLAVGEKLALVDAIDE